MSTSIPLGTIDVRYVLPAQAGEAEYAALLRKLPLDEQALAARFLHLRDRLAFAIGRVLARSMLSHYAAEPIGDWRFERNRYGKPAIVRDAETPDLRFNISHCAGAVVVAVAHEHEVGVDVELLDEGKADCLELAREHFTASEVDLLKGLPTAQQQRAFLALWTLKEAYLKARGTGLSEPLSEVSFRLDPPSIVSSATDLNRADRWFFAQEQLPSQHLLAIAAERHSEETILYRVTQMDLAELLEQA